MNGHDQTPDKDAADLLREHAQTARRLAATDLANAIDETLAEIAALRSRVTTMADALAVCRTSILCCHGGADHKDALDAIYDALATTTGSDTAAPLKTAGGTW